MPHPIRIAVVGLDHWYAAIPFAEQVAAHPDATLVAIVDPHRDRAAEVAARTGCDRVETDPATVLADPSIDAVACFSSVDRSSEFCIAAAGAGKHIVAVKPVAMTLADADRVVEAVERAGVVFVPSESRRTSPLAKLLSSWVHSGRLGDLRSGSFAMNSSVPKAWPGAEDPGWWVDPLRAPGGGWIDHAVYQIDRMRWLFDSDVVATTGRVATIAHPELPVEDYGHAVFALGSGAVVTVEDTWLASPGAFTNRSQLVGSLGSVFTDTSTGLFGWAANGDPWTYRALPTDTFDTLDVLLAALRDGVAPSATVRDARQTLSTALDFYASAGRAG